MEELKPDDNATVVPKKCMSLPLGEKDPRYKDEKGKLNRFKEIWSRCTMGGNRIFCFYGDGTWSLDSATKPKTFNQGKFEHKGDEYEFCNMGTGDEVFFNDYSGGKLRVFNPVTGKENEAWG